MHDRTALSLVSIRLYMYGILTSVFTDTEALCLILGMHWPSGSKPLRCLAGFRSVFRPATGTKTSLNVKLRSPTQLKS